MAKSLKGSQRQLLQLVINVVCAPRTAERYHHASIATLRWAAAIGATGGVPYAETIQQKHPGSWHGSGKLYSVTPLPSICQVRPVAFTVPARYFAALCCVTLPGPHPLATRKVTRVAHRANVPV